MSNIKVSSLVLLASCALLFLCSTPVASEETTIKNDADVTLSTDLLPPPLPADDQARGVIYFINLFRVKNKTDDVPDGKEENVLKDDSSEIVGRLASYVILVEDGDDKADTPGSFWDKLTEASVAKDYEAFGEEMAKPLAVRVVSEITGEPKATEDKAEVEKKSRRKRSFFKGCSTCNSGGGGYQNGGAQPATAVLPVIIIKEIKSGGGGGRHNGRHRGGGGNHPQQSYHPGVMNYPNQGGGGGHYPVGDGGGHGGSYASASANANAYSSTYGR